jgi:NAD(P)-dependent dehydrogenase (short-subunit alcohol dehydrogenase family)
MRRVLITGCSSGLGLALAQRFAAAGWQVLAGLRDPATAPAALAGIETIALDLGDEASIRAAAAGIGALDCLVANAGYALVGPFASYTLQQMQAQLQVNFLGHALLAQLLLPALRPCRGRVIVMSSMAGETGLPLNAMYCASKFALEGWAEALSHELPALGVQIALVEPGGRRTRFADNLRWGDKHAGLDAAEQRQLAGYKAMLARLLSRPGKDATAVCDAVLRLAEAKQMRLRTRVGGDALAVHWLKALLPEGLSQALLRRSFRRLLDKPAA